MLLTLYLEFFKIGAFAVGGGLATIPFLQDLIIKYGWITQSELIDIVAVAESTPGAVGVNAATFMGYKVAGVWGGITSVLGLVTPFIIIIVIIAHFFAKFKDNKKVKQAFYGIRPVAAGIIGAAGIEVGLVAFGIGVDDIITQVIRLSIGLGIYFLITKFKKHAIVYIILGALLGIFIL